MKVGITCYPTYGGSGIVATELGMELGFPSQRAASRGPIGRRSIADEI